MKHTSIELAWSLPAGEDVPASRPNSKAGVSEHLVVIGYQVRSSSAMSPDIWALTAT